MFLEIQFYSIISNVMELDSCLEEPVFLPFLILKRLLG